MSLLGIVAMTGKAALIHFIFGEGGEANDLADIATAFHMFRARTVTRLATVAALQGSFEVWGGFEILFIEVFVARFTDVSTNVLSSRFAWNSCIILLGLSRQPRMNYE
jgi:hypothetical protein